MKILVLGDIHLKPRHFDRADKILASGQADFCVQMGDLVDDWGEEHNIGLYERTLKRAIKFKEDHPETLWVTGNHDFGYLRSDYGPRESGHSKIAELFVRPLFRQLPQQILHIVDGVFFTHAGLTQEWVDMLQRRTGVEEALSDKQLLELVNIAAPDDLWLENSPIWARPQVDEYIMYPAKLQVVGHTPVKTAGQDNGVLSTDTLSTNHMGVPVGDQRLVIVDTETGGWHYAEDEV